MLRSMTKCVLCLLGAGFEEIEAVAPIDLLRRAGAKVVVASLTDEKMVIGRSALVVQADTTLSQVADQVFDMLLIPGGPGVKGLRADGRPGKLAAAYLQGGKALGAICAAPLILADAGALAGRRFTAHYSTRDELPQALADEKVVQDGNLITSRGAGTAIDFGLALVRQLFRAEAAETVAKAIML